VLNTWEAVYFDHDLPTLIRLVEAAAEVGIERFVLDDGWFAGRSDDRRALGDWFVDEKKWPAGLSPLIDRVNAAGMDFGLWVEPEMVSDDSELARQHPEWILGSPDSPTWRFQRVLDLGNADAFGPRIRASRLNRVPPGARELIWGFWSAWIECGRVTPTIRWSVNRFSGIRAS
jgi:alpha-galactosidase